MRISLSGSGDWVFFFLSYCLFVSCCFAFFDLFSEIEMAWMLNIHYVLDMIIIVLVAKMMIMVMNE